MRENLSKTGTTIYVSKSSRDRLKELGKKGENYDQVLERLLNRVERKKRGDN